MTQYDHTQHVADSMESRDTSSQKGTQRKGRRKNHLTLASHDIRVWDEDTKDMPTASTDDLPVVDDWVLERCELLDPVFALTIRQWEQQGRLMIRYSSQQPRVFSDVLRRNLP